MTSNSPAPGPQDLFQEEVLGAKADHCKGMSGHVVDDASGGQQSIIKNSSKASATRSEKRPIPAPDRGREWEGDGRAMNEVLDSVAFGGAAQFAWAKAALKPGAGKAPIAN